MPLRAPHARAAAVPAAAAAALLLAGLAAAFAGGGSDPLGWLRGEGPAEALPVGGLLPPPVQPAKAAQPAPRGQPEATPAPPPHGPVAAATDPFAASRSALPPAPGWRVARAFTTDGEQPKDPFLAFNPQNLQWTDVDGDGRPEILAPNLNGRVLLLDPAGGILAEVRAPGGTSYVTDSYQPSVPVADLDGDGRNELYVLHNDGMLRQFVVEPRAQGGFDLRYGWDRCLRCGLEVDGTPWAAGGLLFVQHDDEELHWAIAHDGSTRWRVAGRGGNAGPVVADLDGNGELEVVFGTDNGYLLARSIADGALRWEIDLAGALGVQPGAIPFQPTVADLDGDGKLEVAASVKVAGGAGRYVLVAHDGTLRWSAAIAGGNPMAAMHPVPLDVDGDGGLDLVWLDWNTRGHNPGAYARLGPANLFALRGHDGALLWRADVDASWSNVDLVVADVDGDGAQEIVVPERRAGREGLGVRGLDGAVQTWWPLPQGWTAARGAVAVPWEGRLHLLVSLATPPVDEGHQSLASQSPDGMLLLLDTGQPYHAAWSGRLPFAT